MTPWFVKITGWEPVIDHASTGAAARAYRRECKIPARTVAETMKIRPSHLSEMESGKRKWNRQLASEYWRAVHFHYLYRQLQTANSQL